MTSRLSRKSLYDLHSWIGIYLGLALYVLMFSGSLSLFVEELQPWIQGVANTLEPGEEATGLDRAVTHVMADIGATEDASGGIDLSISLANTFRPFIEIRHAVDGLERVWYFNPRSGEPRAYRNEGLALVFERLHIDLLLPYPYGRYLTGVLGVAMLVSIFSGVLLHRKIFKELFVLRLNRGIQLKWSDLHKSLGTWALPFLLMISATGAYLGLASPVLQASAFVAFHGNVDAARLAFSSARPAPSDEVRPVPVSQLLSVARNAIPDYEVQQMNLKGFGGPKATASVLGNAAGKLVYYPSVIVDANSAEILKTTNWRNEHWPKAVFATFTPLHYSSYGGTILKVLYAILGLAGSFMIAFGMRIWLQRETGSGMFQQEPLTARLCTGVFFGLPLACAALMPTSRLLHQEFLASYPGRVTILLAVWAAALLWALLRGSQRSQRGMLAFLGVSLLSVPVLTALSFGPGYLSLFKWPITPTLAVDLCCAFAGSAVFTTKYWRMRQHRAG